MTRTPRGETFADIVARTRAEPPAPEPDDPDAPRLPGGERLVRDRDPRQMRDLPGLGFGDGHGGSFRLGAGLPPVDRPCKPR